MPFFVAPAPDDLPPSRPGSQPTLVRIVIDGRLRDFPHAANANALSIFSRSISAGLSHMTRTTLEWTLYASNRRGIALEYAAIPADYPLHGAFNFNSQEQRALFQYAARCSEQGRLWIRAAQGAVMRAGTPQADSTGPICPADDQFIERFAALDR
jgi:hypothetical protein